MREAVFIKSNQSQHRIQDFRGTNQNAGFEFILDLPKTYGAILVYKVKICILHGNLVKRKSSNHCGSEISFITFRVKCNFDINHMHKLIRDYVDSVIIPDQEKISQIY